jgi:hypothetical protein
MAYILDWMVNKRVIHLRIDSLLVDAEIDPLSQQLQTMIEEGTAPVHVLEDNRLLRNVDDLSADAIKTSMESVDFSKVGQAVVLLPEPLGGVSDVLGTTAEFVDDLTCERVETLPDALNHFAEHDSTLPELRVSELT